MEDSAFRDKTAPKKILVVDDEEGIRELITDSLKMNGYHVLDADDGNTALGILARHQEEIGLIITDVVMPTMDGLQLVDHVFTLYPETAIVLISGKFNLDMME